MPWVASFCLALPPQVLVFELLLGKGFRGGGGRWKPLLARHQARLKAELARLKVHRGVSRNEDLLEVGSKLGPGELEGTVGSGEGASCQALSKRRLCSHLLTAVAP